MGSEMCIRDSRWSATVLHGLCVGLHAVPLQEVMGLMASYVNLLVGSKPRTLPIRPSMTTTMLIFVMASLLTSDPIIHAPHAVCDAACVTRVLSSSLLASHTI